VQILKTVKRQTIISEYRIKSLSIALVLFSFLSSFFFIFYLVKINDLKTKSSPYFYYIIIIYFTLKVLKVLLLFLTKTKTIKHYFTS